jgi:hypothetical protein
LPNPHTPRRTSVIRTGSSTPLGTADFSPALAQGAAIGDAWRTTARAAGVCKPLDAERFLARIRATLRRAEH